MIINAKLDRINEHIRREQEPQEQLKIKIVEQPPIGPGGDDRPISRLLPKTKRM